MTICISIWLVCAHAYSMRPAETHILCLSAYGLKWVERVYLGRLETYCLGL